MSTPLYNYNMERAVLSAVLFRPELMKELQNSAKVEFFHLPDHQRIYSTMLFLVQNNKPVDEELIRVQCGRMNPQNNIEDAMLEIMATNPLPSIGAYVQELNEKFQKRELMKISGELHKKILEDEDAEAIKMWLSQRQDTLKGGFETRAKSFSVCKKELIAAKPVELIKTFIGFIDQPLSIMAESQYDHMRHGGFETGRFVLLMGDPEAGKTMLSVQIMKNVSKHEIVMFFAFEFTVRSFVRTQLRVEGDNYENHNLQIVDDGYDITDIVREMRIWRDRGCRLAVIDSQMRVTNTSKKKATSEEVETEKFSILAKTARELDMTVIYICQQGKEDAKGGVITPMGSKKGGHEADIILYLKKEKGSEDRELEFNKNKQTGKHFVKNLTFVRDEMVFKAINKEEQKGKGDKVPLSPAEKKGAIDVTVVGTDGTQTKIDFKKTDKK